jgi:phosphatidylinositol phospholipase C, delta
VTMSDPSPTSTTPLSARLANMNPFANKKPREYGELDFEENGEKVDGGTLAGGGHGARKTDISSHLRVSDAVKSFLVAEGVLTEEQAGIGSDDMTKTLRSIVDRPHISVPSQVTDRSYPLPEYFISSSHNTYLLAHQLYGSSSAEGYETALKAGSRCVEIDAWDNGDDKQEPKVTHGYTLVSHIPFRAVCETIRDVIDAEAAQSTTEQGYRAAPILLSLENHCNAEGQLRLVQIMKEVLGDRLLSSHITGAGGAPANHVGLDQLGSKVVLIVEYHFPEEVLPTEEQRRADQEADDSSSEDEEEKKTRHAYEANKKAAASTIIIPELAELGVYAQSVKPVDNSWFEEEVLKNGPHHHLINLSESQLAEHLPKASDKISRHNAKHLMRVYPKGTRISSKNLQPVPFWSIGAQVCALNWQTFGASMQINEALFSGTDGYVLKPSPLRTGGTGVIHTGKKKRLGLRIAGASDVPLPEGREADDIKPYITCTLVYPGVDGQLVQTKQKTAPYKHHKLGLLHGGRNSPATDPLWNQTLEWTYDDSELVFVRFFLKSDDAFAANPIFAVSCVRLLYATNQWSFIRLLDLKGKETRCSLLVKFDIVDA